MCFQREKLAIESKYAPGLLLMEALHVAGKPVICNAPDDVVNVGVKADKRMQIQYCRFEYKIHFDLHKKR